jgi:hypothetical protein
MLHLIPGQQECPVPESRQPGSRARLVKYEPWSLPNASLIGHASIDFSGWVVARIPIFRRDDGSLSAGGPSAAEVDAEGRQRLNNGKRRYWSVVTFASSDAWDRWQRAVLGALAAGGITP